MIINASKSIELDARLFSGVYFIQVCGGDECKVLKMMIELPVNEAEHLCRPPPALELVVTEARLWAPFLPQADGPACPCPLSWTAASSQHYMGLLTVSISLF